MKIQSFLAVMNIVAVLNLPAITLGLVYTCKGAKTEMGNTVRLHG